MRTLRPIILKLSMVLLMRAIPYRPSVWLDVGDSSSVRLVWNLKLGGLNHFYKLYFIYKEPI